MNDNKIDFSVLQALHGEYKRLNDLETFVVLENAYHAERYCKWLLEEYGIYRDMDIFRAKVVDQEKYLIAVLKYGYDSSQQSR